MDFAISPFLASGSTIPKIPNGFHDSLIFVTNNVDRRVTNDFAVSRPDADFLLWEYPDTKRVHANARAQVACLYTLPRASERRLATRPGHLTAEASEDVRAAHRLVELAVQLLVVPRCCPRLGKARGLLLRQARHQFGQHIHAAERAAASENRGACKRVV